MDSHYVDQVVNSLHVFLLLWKVKGLPSHCWNYTYTSYLLMLDSLSLSLSLFLWHTQSLYSTFHFYQSWSRYPICWNGGWVHGSSSKAQKVAEKSNKGFFYFTGQEFWRCSGPNQWGCRRAWRMGGPLSKVTWCKVLKSHDYSCPVPRNVKKKCFVEVGSLGFYKLFRESTLHIIYRSISSANK